MLIILAFAGPASPVAATLATVPNEEAMHDYSALLGVDEDDEEDDESDDDDDDDEAGFDTDRDAEEDGEQTKLRRGERGSRG